MKPAEQAYIETMPPGASRESWRRAFEAVNPFRGNPPGEPQPRIDPATCIEAFLLRLPPSADQDMWREALELFAHQRPGLFRNTDVDPLIWRPPAGYDTYPMPNPTPPPIGTTTPLPPIPWAEYYEAKALPLTEDSILESIDPIHLRMKSGNGETIATHLAAIWLGHLAGGDRLAPGPGGTPGWRPGLYYPPGPWGGTICWMSRLAA
jgi:hypothetical protein